MRIAIYAICGAGEDNVCDRFYDTCRDADSVIVCPTAKEAHGDYRYAIHVAPFRFDDARNAALAFVPRDIDICIALDMDETLEPDWREALEAAYTESDIPIAYWIDFNFNGTIFRQNNRVHSRHGWRWKYPCHEALVPSMQEQTRAVETRGFTITHRPDTSKPRPNYLGLLAWGPWEDPTSLRMLFYYGRELMFNRFYKDAAERFEAYLALAPEGYFPDEVTRAKDFLEECRDNLKG